MRGAGKTSFGQAAAGALQPHCEWLDMDMHLAQAYLGTLYIYIYIYIYIYRRLLALSRLENYSVSVWEFSVCNAFSLDKKMCTVCDDQDESTRLNIYIYIYIY
jgi:hypothetical protein